VRELEARGEMMSQRLEEIRVEQSRLEAAAPDGTSPTVGRLLAELQAVAVQATSSGASAFLPSAEDVIAGDVLSAAQELHASITSLVEGSRARVLELQRVERGLADAAQRRARRRELLQQVSAQRAAAEVAEAALASLIEERETLARRLAEVRAAITAAKATADEFAAFLVSAEPFVDGESCPVCEQRITPADVAARLRERSQHIPDSLRMLEDERRTLEEQDAALKKRTAQPEASLVSLRDQIASLEMEQTRLDASETEWHAVLAAASLSDDPDPADVASGRQLQAARVTEGDQLTRQVDAVLVKARYLASEDRRSRLAEQERRLQEERSNAVAQGEHARASHKLLQGITAAAKESELDIVKRLTLEQKPLLNALYQRLRPHPILDQLDIDFGQFSQRGEVYFHAVAGDKRANVSAIFSSAQLNAVAICIFLSLNISAGEARVALLDDPIQNMDDFNALGLLDLLRSVSQGRQVVVSTHDAQLGELMRRKLRPLQLTRRTITHEFAGYDELGPRVDTKVDEFSEPPHLLPSLAA
jgi:DNA repair exonuclease SbcCD ATPase subunit